MIFRLLPHRSILCDLILIFIHIHHIFDEIIIVPGCTAGMDPMVRLLAHRAVDAAGIAVEIGSE